MFMWRREILEEALPVVNVNIFGIDKRIIQGKIKNLCEIKDKISNVKNILENCSHYGEA